MKQVTAMVIKYVMIAAISAILLPLMSTVTVAQALVIALLITLAAYLVGDLLVLVNMGNLSATVGDGVIAALVVWLSTLIFLVSIPWWAIIITGAAVAAGEWFFHQYLVRNDVLDLKVRGENK